MRWNGETPLPKPIVLPGEKYLIPSRDAGREIPCRIIKPDSGSVKGVFLHIHGGGWVLQSEEYQDPLLKVFANSGDLLVISIGYRLAPEDPFPAGPNDCYDAAEWLVSHSQSKFHAPLLFMGGESAGGHLAVLTALHLLNSPDKKYSSFQFKGLLLSFGAYDMSWAPQTINFQKPVPLVLDLDIMNAFRAACCPGLTGDQLKDPAISPLYADLTKLKLPSAWFGCGTEDCLLDDTMFMSTKWLMAGGEAIVKIYPGAPHGFIMFPPDVAETTRQGRDDIEAYIKAKMK